MWERHSTLKDKACAIRLFPVAFMPSLPICRSFVLLPLVVSFACAAAGAAAVTAAAGPTGRWWKCIEEEEAHGW